MFHAFKFPRVGVVKGNAFTILGFIGADWVGPVSVEQATVRIRTINLVGGFVDKFPADVQYIGFGMLSSPSRPRLSPNIFP